jgi:hypothetical protein
MKLADNALRGYAPGLHAYLQDAEGRAADFFDLTNRWLESKGIQPFAPSKPPVAGTSVGDAGAFGTPVIGPG